MTKQYLQRMPTDLAESHTEPPQRAQPDYVVHVHQTHWLTAIERLHPSAQLALAVGLGAGVPFALVALGGSLVGILGGLAAFGLVLLNMFTQFALTVGAGVGIIIIVVVGITAISNIK